MKKILLFPFNGNAREAASVIEDINSSKAEWELLGFVDDNRELAGRKFGRYQVIGGREKLAEYPEAMVLAVPGRPENFRDRAGIIGSLGIDPSRFATIIHPGAVIGIDCEIGPNSLLMAHVVLTASVRIGSHVIILPNTVTAHDSRIEDYTVIASNVSISGGARLRENCYLGAGARIIQGVTIGEKSLVGMGSIVLRDVPPFSTVAGNPARIIRRDA